VQKGYYCGTSSPPISAPTGALTEPAVAHFGTAYAINEGS
jgi:hypothetical protein